MPKTLLIPKLEDYIYGLAPKASKALNWIEANTKKNTAMPEMLCGPLEAAYLALMVRLTGAKKILEIGCYTGYSALAMAEALPSGGKVLSLELDPEHVRIARLGLKRSSAGKKVQVMPGHALSLLPQLKGRYDLVFIDADKLNYPKYYEAALKLGRKGALVLIDNSLWSGEVLKPRSDQAKAIAALNQKIAKDKRVEAVLLPLRDGLTVVRKK